VYLVGIQRIGEEKMSESGLRDVLTAQISGRIMSIENSRSTP
jgi:hypothetical protein